MMQYTTIFWDVDDTLLDFSYSMRHALTKCFASIGRGMTEEILNCYTQINHSFWKRLELGEITKEELLPGRFVALFAACEIEGVDVETFRHMYEDELGNVFYYLDDSLNICKKLKPFVRQYVVTNGVARVQRKKLELAGFAEVMDGFFISEEIGTPKPHASFFEFCLSHVEEKDPKKILLVGDSLTSDIKGGVQAGISTCWYKHVGKKNESQWCSDYEIDDLHQVEEIIAWQSPKDKN